MRIAIVVPGTLPVKRYGGTQRVMWGLGRALVRKGHNVCFITEQQQGNCSFAELRQLRRDVPLRDQLPQGTDIVHFNDQTTDLQSLDIPHVITINGNAPTRPLDVNSIFVSANHANRYGSSCFVYNGIDWDTVGPIDLSLPRSGYHFLGKAAWSVKNVRGAICVARQLPTDTLTVLGGYRLNLKMGFRLTLSRRVQFLGMVDDDTKYSVMQHSRGLIFPVTWHEPFGLAVIESLYAGCPVFATPYGSLPELIPDPRLGFLSDSAIALVDHLLQAQKYEPALCHEYARDKFNADVMAEAYLSKYEQVLNGKVLNPVFGEYQSCYRDLPWHKK